MTLRFVFLGLSLPLLYIRPAIAQDAAERPDHLILISIDGLRPEFYLDPNWPAPTLQEMARTGVRALAVRSVYPSVTYPSHTTIVTGANPASHGVVYNAPFEPGGQTGRWYWEEDSVRIPTIWDAVRAAGKTTGSVSWPVTVGGPIDFNVPEIWPIEAGIGRVEAIRRASTPPGLLDRIEEHATGSISVDDIDLDFVELNTLLSTMGAYIFREHMPDLLAVHIFATDHFQHDHGRDHVMVRRTIANADAAVWRLVEATKHAGTFDKTAFIVTGDHGFADIHTRLAPNVWLAEAGLLEPEEDRGDWRAAFHTSGAPAFLHLRDPSDLEAIDRVRRVMEELPQPVRNLFRIVERDELDALGSAPEALLALEPVPGVDLISSAQGRAVRPASGGTHGYMPGVPAMKTGFVGWGPGFASQVTIPEIGLVDIAPMIAKLLNLDFDAPDGILFPGIMGR